MTSKDPKLIAAVARRSDASPKQRKAALLLHQTLKNNQNGRVMPLEARNASVPKHPRSKAVRAKPPASGSVVTKLAALEHQIATLMHGSPAAGIIPTSARDHPDYAEKWLHRGMPQDMPVPKPYNSVLGAADPFVVIDGNSNWGSITIPAGESALISGMYTRVIAARAFVTSATRTAGVPVTATDWTADGMVVDRTNAASAIATFLGDAPQSLLEDTDLISADGVEYTKLPAGGLAPLVHQRLGTILEIQFTNPLNGLASVRTVCPGDSPGFVGRKQEHHTYDSWGAGGHTQGLKAQYLGGFHGVFSASNNETPREWCVRVGRLQTVGGLKNYHSQLHGHGDSNWSHWGSEGPTAAAAGGITNVSNNMQPRQNIPFWHKTCYALVDNDSTVSMTVNFRVRHVFACIVPADDANRTISPLVNQIRRTAERLGFHPNPTSSMNVLETIAASSLEGVNLLRASKFGQHASPGVSSTPAHIKTGPSTMSKVVEYAADAGAVYQGYQAMKWLRGGGLGRAVDSVKNAIFGGSSLRQPVMAVESSGPSSLSALAAEGEEMAMAGESLLPLLAAA